MLLETTPFKRGTTFSFLLQLPNNVDDGFFANWTPRAQLRKRGVELTKGLVQEVACHFTDAEVAKIVRVFEEDTDSWPIGLVELDVLFEGPNGERVASETLVFDIVREITK